MTWAASVQQWGVPHRPPALIQSLCLCSESGVHVQESSGGIFFFEAVLHDWGNESVNNLVLHWSFSVCLFADSWDVCPKRWLYPYWQVSCVLMLCGAPSNLCWVCFPLNTHVWALLLSCARMFSYFWLCTICMPIISVIWYAALMHLKDFKDAAFKMIVALKNMKWKRTW